MCAVTRVQARSQSALQNRLVHSLLLLPYGAFSTDDPPIRHLPIGMVQYSTLQTVHFPHLVHPIEITTIHSLTDLDRANLSNAYVSGMREELNMYGTQYNVSLDLPTLPSQFVTD